MAFRNVTKVNATVQKVLTHVIKIALSKFINVASSFIVWVPIDMPDPYELYFLFIYTLASLHTSPAKFWWA